MFDPRDISRRFPEADPGEAKARSPERAPGAETAPGAGPSLIRDPTARISRGRTERAVAEIGMYRDGSLQGSIGGAF